MSRWLDLAAGMEASGEGSANSANSANRSPAGSPNDPIGTNGTGLPDDLSDGLKRLSGMASPLGVDPQIWATVVQDARLVAESWALSAIRLGWSPLDLFGAVPYRHDDPDADGLAVKLDGRPILALCASFATVKDGPSARSFIYRGNNKGAVLLWNLGRMQPSEER